jgi:NAD(P)-dependent dehydrogenase (short-subunit alcohol dehydrogenase family)
MNILVIGGTRLLGRAIVKRLNAAGHLVTVVSRSCHEMIHGIEYVEAERIIGLAKLRGRKYDITIDLIAYDELALKQVFDCVDCGVYVLISTTWITRLAPDVGADQPGLYIDNMNVKFLPAITFSYLIGKLRAESAALEIGKRRGIATILRLPIFWGENEHTGRLDFYRQRINDGNPIICVNGGQNCAQLVWVEDVAAVVPKWIMRASEKLIWEALPNKGSKARDIINTLASGKAKQSLLVDVSSEQLQADLPEYLIGEPLWRENSLELTESNLFTFTGGKPTPMSTWLCELAKRDPLINMSNMRSNEIKYIKTLRNIGAG